MALRRRGLSWAGIALYVSAMTTPSLSTPWAVALLLLAGCVEVPAPLRPAADASAIDRGVDDVATDVSGDPAFDGSIPDVAFDGPPPDIDQPDGAAPDATQADSGPAANLCGDDGLGFPIDGQPLCLRYERLADMPGVRGDLLLAVMSGDALLVYEGTDDGGRAHRGPTWTLPEPDGQWVVGPSPEEPRVWCNLTVDREGRAHLTGGKPEYNDGGPQVTRVETWSQADGGWQVSGIAAAGHADHGAVAWEEGVLLVGGRGGETGHVDAIDPWPDAVAVPPPLPDARRSPPVFRLEGALVVLGGVIDTAYVADTWVWRQGEPGWTRRHDGDAPADNQGFRAASDGTSIVFTGGRDADGVALGDVWLFTLDGGWQRLGDLSRARERHVVTPIASGQYLVAGSGVGVDLIRVDPPAVVPVGAPADFPPLRRRGAAARLSDGSAIVLGGKLPGNGPFLSDVWRISVQPRPAGGAQD